MNANDNMLNGSTNDLDNLLDSTLDDLADMPEFKPFPAGAHTVTINWDYSKFGTDKTIEIKATYVAPVEVPGVEEDALPKVGDTTNQRFMLKKKDGTKNDLAEGQWKRLLEPLQAHFGTASIRETMDASQGAEVMVVTKIRTDKRDPQDIKYYTDFTSVAVV